MQMGSCFGYYHINTYLEVIMNQSGESKEVFFILKKCKKKCKKIFWKNVKNIFYIEMDHE